MASRYLDPRNDLVFKRIFGEHPNILRSFLNALLPLPEDGLIESLEYLAAEQVPEVPLLKNTIVDVRCRDQRGRQFIVEMQMNWTSAFLQRVLFNASKAYVGQLSRGMHYELLQPVIGLSLLDAVYQPESEAFYHHYRLVEKGEPSEVIEGLQLVFIELPKVKAEALDPPLRQAWLRFLNETGDADTPAEAKALQSDLSAQSPELGEALELAAEAAFTPGELMAYDRYWDAVSTERTLLVGKTREARELGMAQGRAEGIQQGIQEGIEQGIEQGMEQGMELGLAKGIEAGRAAERSALLQKLIASGMSEAEASKLLS